MERWNNGILGEKRWLVMARRDFIPIIPNFQYPGLVKIIGN